MCNEIKNIDYKKYYDMVVEAEKKVREHAEECKAKENEIEKHIEENQNKIAVCYDNQKIYEQKSKELKGKIDGINSKINQLQKDVNDKQKEIDRLNDEIEKYKHKEHVSDILKFIPLVNIGALIYEAIADNDKKVKQYTNDKNVMEEKLNELNKESKAAENELRCNEVQINQFNKQVEDLKKEREQMENELATIKKELVQASDEAVLYGCIAKELENVIEGLETDEEFMEKINEITKNNKQAVKKIFLKAC